MNLKDNAVDVARLPADKVAIASVHPGIGEKKHEELHGRPWVFQHNVPDPAFALHLDSNELVILVGEKIRQSR